MSGHKCCNPNVIETDLITYANEFTNASDPWGIVVTDNHMWVVLNSIDKLVRYDLCGNCPKYINFADEQGILMSNQEIEILKPAPSDISPTGIIINHFGGFKIRDPSILSDAYDSTFLICSKSGDIFGYNSNLGDGSKAIRLYAGSLIESALFTPAYTGLALNDKYLFATDFSNGKIDMFIGDCHCANNITFINSIIKYLPPIPITTTVQDDEDNHFLSYPFNIVAICDELYVMYAYKNDIQELNDNGTGGFIDIHDKHGIFTKRFTTGGHLVSPWAFMKVPNFFGCGECAFLVGNHSMDLTRNTLDGSINIYDKFGHHIGQFKTKCQNNIKTPLVLYALWGLFYHNHKLYFTIAQPTNGSIDPQKENIVGFLKPKCNHAGCEHKKCSHH